MLRHALVLLLAVVFGTFGATATAAASGGPGDTARVGATAEDTSGSADVVRVAGAAASHAATPGPLAVTTGAVSVPGRPAAATGPGSTPSATRAGVSSTTQDRAPPGAAR